MPLFNSLKEPVILKEESDVKCQKFSKDNLMILGDFK